MKSNSGNDGSYTLTVSFELGTNPDINTVNVNNRVQTALSQLPAGGAAQRRDGAEALLGDPGVPAVLQRGRQAGPAVHQQLRHHQRAGRAVAHAGRRPGLRCSAQLDYSMRIWFDINRLVSLNLSPSDIIAAIQAQNVQAPVGRIGARPTADEHAVPAQRADPGPAGHARAVRRHRAARQSRRLACCASRDVARDRARRREHGQPRAG